MKQIWREPTLDEIINDPTLDTLLARSVARRMMRKRDHG